jgi:hypothetical protein
MHVHIHAHVTGHTNLTRALQSITNPARRPQPEPSQDAADAITLRVRMPGGPPHARRFLPEQTVADALAWVRCFLSGDASGGGKLNLAAGLFSGAVRPELLLQPAATLGEVAGSARQLTLFAAVGAQRAGG